jgi:hypothetical protein
VPLDPATSTVWIAPAAVAVFATSIFQGACGFGMALLCIPMLAMLVEPRMAVECMTVASLGTTATMAFAYRSHWDVRRAAWLGIPLLVGTPFGVYLLKVLTDNQLKAGVGIFLIVTSGAYVIQFMLGKHKGGADVAPASGDMENDRYSHPACVVVGFLSGVLGGATGLTGPLLANYLIRTGIQREAFKATLSLIFTASGAWRSTLFVSGGMIKGDLLLWSLAFIPISACGTFIGMRLDRRIPAAHFVSVVHFLLLGMGVWFLVMSWRARLG